MTRPMNKLPPESAMWGRSVERELDALRSDLNRLTSDTGNANSQAAGTMAALASQISSMNSVLGDLSTVVATLSTARTAGATNLAGLGWSSPASVNTGWIGGNTPSIPMNTLTGNLTILGSASTAWGGYRSSTALSYRVTNVANGVVVRNYGSGNIARVANLSETEELQSIVLADTITVEPGQYVVSLGCQGYAGTMNGASGEFTQRTIIGWSF